ncbi:MAG: OmpA family protein [Desulfuromusa sp.]|nr:OmpA family protein [Desulfuromusa sp.]
MKIRAIVILSLMLIFAVWPNAFVAAEMNSRGVEPKGLIREVVTPGAATEMHLPSDHSLTPWILDPTIFDEDQGDQVEVRQVVEQVVKTVKLTALLPPIRFLEGEAEIPENYLARLRDVLATMLDKNNVRLHFVGHADSQPLSPVLQTLYGDNIGLSRERAGTTAEYCQRALNLPAEAISYEGAGANRPIASNATEEGRALNRRVEVEVWYDEIGEITVDKEVIVPRTVSRIKVCRTETVCKLRYKVGHSHRARIKNLIAPLYFNDGLLSVSQAFLQQIRQVRKNLSTKKNVLVKFVAYTDNTPLAGRQKRIYGTSLGLSKAVSRRVALAVQDALALTNADVDSEGKGATQPAASNVTPKGRALNRRIEVEFWHDDPLQDLSEEPQICPEDAGAETVTRIYDSPLGGIDPILFENGQPIVSARTVERLHQTMSEIVDKSNVRLRFVGYTSNERLNRRTAAVYGDDIGWSTARARRAMEAVSEKLGLTPQQAEFEGHGYVQTDDVVNAGFIEADTSRVEVQIIYDELAILDEYEGVKITRLVREVKTENPFALNLMRITVDGNPVDDPGKSIPDVQRCTDVELDKAQVQFKHNSIKSEPRLNITAWPRSVRYRDVEETKFVENQVNFRLYTNYRSFIERAEVRIFEEQQSVRDKPLVIIAVSTAGQAQWRPDFDSYSASGKALKYLVRVYDKDEQFDETKAQPLWLVDQVDPIVVMSNPHKELLAGYGESRIASRNIPLRGGTVQAHGKGVPDGHVVWLAGYAVPVDDRGNFVAEEILPEGLHTVEVAVLDQAGNGELFLRDLALKKSDWFTVGIADLTLSKNKTTGPANLLAPDNQRYSEDTSFEGRLAFYSSGKLENGWALTASADTGEGPVDEIFSNFMDKTPAAQFRRMDTDRHYPTFGDDSTLVEDAPTQGKFYLKMKKNETSALWGNFSVAYAENDLAHVDRELYGANLHFQPVATTSFGEPRLLLDGFGADPGTVAKRDEFLGSGGSLYYLQQQDILQGSESIRIEVRDKDSGIVLGVKVLAAELDYDIDYIQGRILLSEILPATANDNLLVATDSISGNPVYLVVRYEYTPGFNDPDTLVTGGRGHYWFNDYLKVGVTASQDEEADVDSSVIGVDLIMRKSSASWLKLQVGRTKGPGVLSESSADGGYSFTDSGTDDNSDGEASAYQVEGSVGFNEFFDSWLGRMTFYLQDREKGYSAPGQATTEDITLYGGTLEVPFAERWLGRLKLDKQVEPEGVDMEAGELNIDYHMTDNWELSTGVRTDNRQDNSVVVPETQEEGGRTDGVVRVTYDSRTRWLAYGFAQETLERTGDREDNGRIGAGGSWRLTDRFKLLGEVSAGDLGTGASLGSEFLYSDKTTMYTSYTLENERTDNGLLSRKGNMTSGVRSRYSDSVSVYLEEQYAYGDVPTGLVHSTGVDFTPTDRLNFSANLDLGNLRDPETGVKLERTAVGVNVGYGFDRVAIASGIEYRRDNTEQSDASDSKRTSWLFKNSFKYQMTPDWRFIGKFNYSQSESSLGKSYDGDYTEAVLGYGYRPINFDRLNVLFKYTYFYDFPATDDVSESDTDFIQRSHIGAVDLMYDLSSRWTLGGKYAYRLGEVAQDRENPDYFDSQAHLYVLRADWHFMHRWDALMEARMLDLPDAQDRRSGALLVLYRHLGNNVKVGVGYNFSDFSDDLTQLDYRHQGVFINLVGKL